MELEERLRAGSTFCVGFIDTNRGVDFVDQESVLTNFQIMGESPPDSELVLSLCAR